MRALIQASKAALTQAQIEDIIGAEKLAKIKADNPGAEILPYAYMHEGPIKPTRLDGNSKPIIVTEDNVKASEPVSTNLHFYEGHNKDNSTEGRKSLGRVVASGLFRDTKKRLTGVVFGAFKGTSAAIAQSLKNISLEGTFTSIERGAESILSSLEKTGFALANSKPAFADSGQLALQCFEPDEQGGEPQKEKTMDFNWKDVAAVRGKLEEYGYYLHELVSKDKLKADRGVQELIKNETELHKKENATLIEDRDKYKKLHDDRAASDKAAARKKSLEPKLKDALEKRKINGAVAEHARGYLDKAVIGEGDELEEAAIQKAITDGIAEDKRLTDMGYVAGEPKDTQNHDRNDAIPPHDAPRDRDGVRSWEVDRTKDKAGATA